MTSLLSAGEPYDDDVFERARLGGVAALGDAELVQLVLRCGRRRPVGSVGARLLEAAGGLALLGLRGLDERTAAGLGLDASQRLGLEAALELGRRATVRRALDEARQVGGPDEVAAWARLEFGGAEREELWLVAVDGRGAMREARRVAHGSSSASVLSVRDVLCAALRTGCPAFLLVHNHPSGDPTPSGSDAEATRALAEAAARVGLALLDHVVVAAEGYASMLELGLFEGRERPPGGRPGGPRRGRGGRKGGSPP
ncbi:MAG TPA: JAB domain-containing protein [Polyangiaceae bacterium]|nr:JAB domain-containing protein [Polyangiaceae bacterium]